VCAPPEIDVSELEAMKARALDFRVDLRRDIRVKDAAVGEARRLADYDRRVADRKRWGF
jgi:hypothetical protein